MAATAGIILVPAVAVLCKKVSLRVSGLPLSAASEPCHSRLVAVVVGDHHRGFWEVMGGVAETRRCTADSRLS